MGWELFSVSLVPMKQKNLGSALDLKQSNTSSHNLEPSKSLDVDEKEKENNQSTKPIKSKRDDDEKADLSKIVNLAGSKVKKVKVKFENKEQSIRFGNKDTVEKKMEKITNRISKKFKLNDYVLTFENNVIRMDDIDKFSQLLAVTMENMITFDVTDPNAQKKNDENDDSQVQILLKFKKLQKKFSLPSDCDTWTDEILDALKKSAKKTFRMDKKWKVSFYDLEDEDDPLDDIEDFQTIYENSIEDENDFKLLVKIRDDLSECENDSDDEKERQEKMEQERREMKMKLEKAEREKAEI